MKNLTTTIKHLRNILVHKWWVMVYGRRMGINFWRLLVHDMSKFSPTEFWESVKYYKGDSSPIPECKKINGFSYAWQHHKGRNPHHYEYWTDNYDIGMTLIPMPYKYVCEMMADWFAAGRTYQGKEFTVKSQCDWWEWKKTTKPAIHEATIDLIDHIFMYIGEHPWDPFKVMRESDPPLKWQYELYMKTSTQFNHDR